MNRSLLSLLFALAIAFPASANVVIIGANSDPDDGMSFVATQDIPASTIFYFTDKEYQGGGDFNTGETVWSWTSAAAGLQAGDVVSLVEDGGSNVISVSCTLTANCGTFGLVSGSFSITGSDQLYAVDADPGTDGNNPGVTEIYSVFVMQGNDAETSPTDISPNAVIVDGFAATGSHRQYTPSLRSALGALEKAQLENPSNYDQLSANAALSLTPFAVPEPSSFLFLGIVSFAGIAFRRAGFLRCRNSK